MTEVLILVVLVTWSIMEVEKMVMLALRAEQGMVAGVYDGREVSHRHQQK
jgi:hypothetical protein